MSLKSALAAALLLAAPPALAQPPAASSPQPPASASPPSAQAGPRAAIQQTAVALGQCISAGIQRVDAAITPEVGATSVLNGCATQRAALDQAVEAMLATMPADQQGPGRAQYQSQLGQARTQIAEGIRQRRAAAAAAPASPAGPATPPAPAAPPPH